jgi:hypothetical protein
VYTPVVIEISKLSAHRGEPAIVTRPFVVAAGTRGVVASGTASADTRLRGTVVQHC